MSDVFRILMRTEPDVEIEGDKIVLDSAYAAVAEGGHGGAILAAWPRESISAIMKVEAIK